MNLDISTYSLDDLYNLFHIELGTELTNDQMKEAKRMALYSHPDKSRLDAKYFLFFSQAYKILYSLYTRNNPLNQSTQYDATNPDENTYLSQFFLKNPQLKTDAHQFNAWFNREFIQTSDLLYEEEQGHGEWFKSDIDARLQTVNKNNLQSYKNQLVIKQEYGASDNAFTGALLGDPKDSNNNGVNFFSHGTDLKQAWTETVFAVSEQDALLHETSIQSYKHDRDRMDIYPLQKETQERILKEQDIQNNRNGMNQTYYYAKQKEKIQDKKQLFWSKLKQLTN